jgi:hypothetical protein
MLELGKWEESKQSIELCISNVTAETLHRVASKE